MTDRLELPAPHGYRIIRCAGHGGREQFRIINAMGVLEVTLPTIEMVHEHLGLRPKPKKPEEPTVTPEQRATEMLKAGRGYSQIMLALRTKHGLSPHVARGVCQRCGVPPDERLQRRSKKQRERREKRRARAAELVSDGYSDADGAQELCHEFLLPHETALAAMWWARSRAEAA